MSLDKAINAEGPSRKLGIRAAKEAVSGSEVRIPGVLPPPPLRVPVARCLSQVGPGHVAAAFARRPHPPGPDRMPSSRVLSRFQIDRGDFERVSSASKEGLSPHAEDPRLRVSGEEIRSGSDEAVGVLADRLGSLDSGDGWGAFESA